ncbi:MAG: Na+/H+ antiporter NhaA [Lewinellaceae bacterium]|nr:Na+/H+ antiporter NhaA [Lewinellaceae bacterium]
MARIFRKTASTLRNLARSEAASGLLLLLFTALAMLWANSGWGAYYFEFWETSLEVHFGDMQFEKPLLVWINDGLMALFFFHIGLEIKREVLVGELSEPRQAFLPLFAAIGGMAFPAAIFWLLNRGHTGAEGWGVPMATDIAFSLGILLLLGKRVPLSFKVFLVAFAIADDIGAVLVIALFYTGEANWHYLAIAAAVYLAIWLANALNFRRPPLYAILSIAMWYFFLKAGVHPTVAGILGAFAIPANNKLRMANFVSKAKGALNEFLDNRANATEQFLAKAQLRAISEIEQYSDMVQPPLQRLEQMLAPYVTFLIMPAFALANAGVSLQSEAPAVGPLTWHIGLALALGKVSGISLFCWLGVKSGLATLPKGCSWLQLAGMGFLGGIGFTMSLFIGSLAFDDIALLNPAKIGILAGSLLSGIIGYSILRYSFRRAGPEVKRLPMP